MTGPPAPPLSLPEELLLLSLDRARGRPVCQTKFLRYGLAGAALADLAVAGRIAVERGDRVVVVNPLPLADPVLTGALAALPDPAKGSRGVKAHRWVRTAGRSVQELCLLRLQQRGAVRRETKRALGLFPYDRYPVGAVDLTEPARFHFRAAVEGGLADGRARTLAGLVAAIDLDTKLLPGSGFRPTRRSLRGLAKTEWPARSAYHAVRQDKASAANAGGGG
ncbi:GPP34 family phosphoprotein [Streptomyces sp. NPDC101393]|uniref:GOLPH3/VPS74 family protein n=1 Tax=Streptomyces sp. NPDC101393 TaxID=3366141 RepID=UPI0038050DE0